MAEQNIHAETLQQLKAARQWLKFLVDELDLDPEDTAFVVNIVSPEGKREVARVTLAHSLSQIDACLEAPRSAPPPSGDRHD